MFTRSDSQEVCSRKQTGREKKGRKLETRPFVLNRKSKMVSDLGMRSLRWPLRLRTECLSSTDLHRAREKQPASFIVLCKDATGESMGRGGDNVQVTVIPNDKKDRFVSCTQASRTWKSKVLCSHGAATPVVQPTSP